MVVFSDYFAGVGEARFVRGDPKYFFLIFLIYIYIYIYTVGAPNFGGTEFQVSYFLF